MHPEILDFLDEFLAHEVAYDPAKRREQYLRTRNLKGRNSGTTDMPSGNQSGGNTAPPGRSNSGNSNAAMRKSRREKLEAEQKELLAKLDRLRAELRVAVAKAKGRSGAEKPDGKEDTSSTKETKTKDSKDSKDSKSEPLTEKEKADKREASKEQYDKEKKMSLTQTVDGLRDQVKDYRVKIEKALSEARERHSANQSETASKGR